MSGNVGTSEDKQWLDVVMPKIAESIGERGTTRYVLSSIKQRFLSDIYFVYMSCTNEINQLSETRMVIKRTKLCKLMEVKNQFHNEIVFYQLFYQSGENFPRYLYGYDASLDSSEYSIVVLEDVSRNGFKESPASFDVPYSYVLAVMRELGRFHAKGYILKETNQAKFQSITDKITETRFCEKTKMRPFVNITSTRVVDYLRAQNHDTGFCDKLEALLSNAFDKVIIPIVTVTESSELLSTICHGDVTLDNMLFQPLNSEYFNAMLIDFGMMRYGTPVVDLSSFFCLCCTNSMVRDKLHDMLAVYHMALTNYMSLGGVADTKKYSYRAILNNYREGCLYGFVLASFYLECLLGHIDPVEIAGRHNDMEMLAKEYKKSGGDQVSAMLAEMLLQMVEMGSLDHFL
ncbi:uncharacterized protein LOC116854024 [Odontomachus brunneus]|uniref:uncharacterized protein LOC116854024 n=1 Tax=Odontomachus brunneus TaxID=486640 RepID=UPI0013F29E65|nr:uncharacterized protein LOC116854024 [Odontomachus brunneus]